MGIPPPIETANISMGDTLLLMVIALVVLGPHRLPQIGRQIGKLMYEFCKASNDFKFQMEEELRQSEEADRRKKEEEERKRALAAAPPPTQIAPPEIAPTVESPITASDQLPPDAQVTPAAPQSPAADVPEASSAESNASAVAPLEPADLKTVGPDESPAPIGPAEPRILPPATETATPRILPPSTGETVPAERPGAQPRQQELFAAADGKNPENAGDDAERSEPATHHG